MTRLNDELDLIKNINPIPETEAQSWVATPRAERVLAEIQSRAGRGSGVPARRARSRWRKPTVTIPILIVLSGFALLFASAVADNATVLIDADDAVRNPRALVRKLAAKGIEARILIRPTTGWGVGELLFWYPDPGVILDDDTFGLVKLYMGEVDGDSRSVVERCPKLTRCSLTDPLELPVNMHGPITLVVGRAAEPGERYWARHRDASNLLIPSGPLYCYRLEEKSPEEAERILRGLGYDVILVHEVPGLSDPVASPPDAAEITWAWFRDSHTIDVRTAAPEEVEARRLDVGTPNEAQPRSSAPWAPDC